MFLPRILTTIIFTSALWFPAQAQEPNALPVSQIEIAAGPEYQTSFLHELVLGKNWRREWATAVTVKQVNLDTIYGGLIPYARSGGGESKSLRLRSKTGKEYALRSINKSRSRLLPKLLRGSPYGALVQDGISMSHPFAAFALPGMLSAAGIPHTNPKLVYIPAQSSLDTFNALYGNDLYLIEEKAEGSWTGTMQLGGFSNYMETEAVKDSLLKNSRIKADQQAFIKARLFDIFISDVDRHGGNWTWGVADTGSMIFTPIPGDRDQAFFTHNGLITKLTLALTRRRWMQSFRKRVSDVSTLTSYDQKLDRFFANEMTEAQWQAAAAHLQAALTDAVIETSIRQLPPEAYTQSGPRMIRTLQARREDLDKYANEYYRFLARSVEINGSAGKDWFELSNATNGDVSLTVYAADKAGAKEKTPFYQRLFRREETRNIRLYGSGGDDVFTGIEKSSIPVLVKKGINKNQFPPMEK